MSTTSRSTLRLPLPSSNQRKSLPASPGTADLLGQAPRIYNLLHGLLSVQACAVAARSLLLTGVVSIHSCHWSGGYAIWWAKDMPDQSTNTS